MLYRLCVVATLLAVLGVAVPGPVSAAPAPCQFILGFKALHDLAPAVVGACVDEQAFAPNGDAQQHTTNGLLVWRKADNWTAFTNGYRTWINGPTGLVERLNDQRFSWEANPGALPNGSAPAATAPPNEQAQILLTSNRASYDDLWVVNSDGSNPRRLTYDGRNYGARWSPDKRHIVYYHYVDGPGFPHDVLVVMDADGTNRRVLTQNVGVTEGEPSWSPDGSHILYLHQSPDEQFPELDVMRSDGADRQRLTKPKWLIEAPVYSPDGQTIAFTSNHDGKYGLTSEIFLMNANGSNVRQLTHDGNRNIHPVWSPDGTKLAYSSLRLVSNGDGTPTKNEAWRIWEINLDGSDPHSVIVGTSNDVERSQNVSAWLGHELLFTSYDGHWVTKIANDDGTAIRIVSTSAGDNKASDWR